MAERMLSSIFCGNRVALHHFQRLGIFVGELFLLVYFFYYNTDCDLEYTTSTMSLHNDVNDIFLHL